MTKRTLIVALAGLLCARAAALYARPDINDDLYSAVNKNDLQAVKNLLAQGADPNARCMNWAGKRDFTPLYAAAESGYTEIVQVLLDAGGDVNAKCPMGQTPLMAAAGKGRTDVVTLLLAKDPAVDTVDTGGESALLFAVESEAGEESATAVVKALLDKGADPNLARDGWTPLMFSAARGKTGMVRLLIAKGADVNAVKDGNTALSFAVSRGYKEIEAALRAAGAKESAASRMESI